jgi:hypothetical protein
MDGSARQQETRVTLRPEQDAALGYARRRGTEAPLAAIRSRLAGTCAEIEDLVAPLTEEEAARRPAPGSWCVHEVVDHLVESDHRASEQLAELVAGRSVVSHIPAGLLSAAPFATPWAGLRARFAAVHRDVLAILDGASDAAPLTATAPVEMVVKCAGPDGSATPVHWIERCDWKAFAILVHAHSREHIAQIRRILTATQPAAEAGGGDATAAPAPPSGPSPS